MWRTIATVVLLPALTVAQNPAPSPQYLQGEVPRPSYWVLPAQKTLRQGSTEQAVLLLLLGNDLVVSSRQSSHDLVPLKIEFDPVDGIAVTSFRFPPDTMMRTALQNNREPLHASLDPLVDSAAKRGSNQPEPAARSNAFSQNDAPRFVVENPPIAVLNSSIPVRLKVKVSKSTAIGEHRLHGHITYQPVRADGVFPPQQMDLALTVTVVDRNARVPNNSAGGQSSASAPHQTRDVVLMILLAPILIPLGILAALVGMDC